jgi:MFS family permease
VRVMASGLMGRPRAHMHGRADNYKWLALSNTTLGVLIVTIDSSIVLISLPDIFRGIHLDPLAPGNSFYLLWMIMGFLIVTAVLVVSLGRLGDIYGRARTYNLGFAVFTFFSIMLSVTWMHGAAGGLWLILMRIGQGFGGAMLFANSAAILTDAFPVGQRGLAMGVNMVAATAGSTIGLVLGGILGPISWRLVFLISVPVGIFGTVWGYFKLRDVGEQHAASIDWLGNLSFAAGLIAVMVGITYGIEPYGHHAMGWTNPKVIAEIGGGLAVLAGFCVIETRVREPMFHLELFRIRAFVAGNIASLLSAIGRGGLQFILIVWLQGIWLPRHGYNFAETPLWAGIYMLPMVGGFLLAGPISGILTDRFGARPFATGGMLIAAGSFILLERLPVDFSYAQFAPLLAINGIGMGLFVSPNRTAIMNSLPANRRGAGAGMSTTFQNSAMVLSIGIFFSLMIVGLSGGLAGALRGGLIAHGVPAGTALRISRLPPVATLFASFLGYNPIHSLLGSSLSSLPHAQAAALTGRSFFPHLISGPFSSALLTAFTFAAACCLIAAVASLLSGGKYYYTEPEPGPEPPRAAERSLRALEPGVATQPVRAATSLHPTSAAYKSMRTDDAGRGY